MTDPNKQPMIDHMPGATPFDESQLPSRDVVPIEPSDVTPQMMNHAIGSPYRQLGEGLIERSARVESGSDTTPATQHVGSTALEAAGATSPAPVIEGVEAAAVRPKRREFTVAQENEQRMGVAAAIRRLEDENGLPHTRDLR